MYLCVYVFAFLCVKIWVYVQRTCVCVCKQVCILVCSVRTCMVWVYYWQFTVDSLLCVFVYIEVIDQVASPGQEGFKYNFCNFLHLSFFDVLVQSEIIHFSYLVSGVPMYNFGQGSSGYQVWMFGPSSNQITIYLKSIYIVSTHFTIQK